MCTSRNNCTKWKDDLWRALSHSRDQHNFRTIRLFLGEGGGVSIYKTYRSLSNRKPKKRTTDITARPKAIKQANTISNHGYQVSSFQSDAEGDPVGPRLLLPPLPRQAPEGRDGSTSSLRRRRRLKRARWACLHLLYGVSVPMATGRPSALLSCALQQTRGPHGPLLNSTTWRTLGGTAADTLRAPAALQTTPQPRARRDHQLNVQNPSCSVLF